jgi:predicted transcriptional regulator
MTPKLTKELTDALHATEDGQVEAIDPETGRVYFVVAGPIHQRAMEALRRQDDRDAIARGIADMEAGQEIAVDEAHANLRQDLRSRYDA